MADITSISGRVAPIAATTPASPAAEKTASAPADSRFEPRDFRLASANRRTAFEVDLTGLKDPDAIKAKVSEALTNLFKAFVKGPELDDRVGTALESLGDVLDRAAESTAGTVGVQIGLARVDQAFGDTGDDPLSARISQFAVEVGLVTDDRVEAADVNLVDLSGERIALTEDQQRRGIATSVYQVDGRIEGAENAQSKARYDALLGALDRLVQVQDALSAFRDGDPSGIQRLERLLRGEDASSRSADALGRLARQEETQTDTTRSLLIPGVGLVEDDRG